MSKTNRFDVTVSVTEVPWAWIYDIHVNHERLILGKRNTRAAARRAARSQLMQLRKEIDQALTNLK
jgi:hypothetical protein